VAGCGPLRDQIIATSRITSNNGTPRNSAWISIVLTTQTVSHRRIEGYESRRLRRALAEVSRPRRVELLDGGQQSPVLTLGRGRRPAQRPAQLGQRLVALAVVAGGAARDAVLPRV